MNFFIFHDSGVEATVFFFLFLEVFPVLGVINGYGKMKSNAFFYIKFKMFVRFRVKEERRE
ncbi:hypothetical protein DQE84_19470 [Staphylococcus warneri]|nr:hypothetical protein DQE84_19470 [Staphylococcus warneri]